MRSDLKTMLQDAVLDTATFAPLTENGTDGIYTLAVPGAEAVSLWQRLRALVPQTGYWPVVLGDAGSIKNYCERLAYDDRQTPAEILRRGLDLDPLAWLAEKQEEWDQDGLCSVEYLRGKWPRKEQPKHAFALRNLYSRTCEATLYLGLVPATQSWEVPAFLKIGGWNDCPFSEIHISLMKYWTGQYGAELVCAAYSVIEMQVSKPPTTREAALHLATEQLLYCSDIVIQGAGTLSNLASILLDETEWDFWWD